MGYWRPEDLFRTLCHREMPTINAWCYESLRFSGFAAKTHMTSPPLPCNKPASLAVLFAFDKPECFPSLQCPALCPPGPPGPPGMPGFKVRKAPPADTRISTLWTPGIKQFYAQCIAPHLQTSCAFTLLKQKIPKAAKYETRRMKDAILLSLHAVPTLVAIAEVNPVKCECSPFNFSKRLYILRVLALTGALFRGSIPCSLC